MFLTTWLAVFFLHYVQIAAFRDGDVRLVNSNRYGTGRLEVFYEGSWGTVCQRGWDLDDTEVICRQLGFPKGAQRFFPGGQFGEGDGRVLLSDVNCIGVESNLLECGNVQGNWASNDCQHGSDVGLQCSAPNFEGCFSTRLLLAIDGITVNGMTLEDCFEFCGKHQYTWVHDGTNCGCGNEIDGAVLVNQEECSINCPGNSDQICGGTDSASIYKVEVDLPYVASPGFPGRYTTTDDVVPIVRNFAPQEVTGYSYIRFHQFELPSTATLLVFSNDRNLTIQGDTDVTEYWISSANNPFQISFLPPPGNTGSLGFLIEFGEGSYCPSTTSVSNGRISTTASMPYTVGTQLRVICDLGFIAYDDEVFCQADGRFNREIRCDSITLATTTPSTTAAATTRTATTTQQPQTVGDNSRTTRPLIPNVTLPVIISVRQKEYTTDEGETITVRFTTNEPAKADIYIGVSTRDSTHESELGPLFNATILEGQSSGTLQIHILEDLNFEGMQTITVSFVSLTNGASISSDDETIRITTVDTTPARNCTVPIIENGEHDSDTDTLSPGDDLMVTCSFPYKANESIVTCQRDGTFTASADCSLDVIIIVVLAVVSVVFVVTFVMVIGCMISNKKKRRHLNLKGSLRQERVTTSGSVSLQLKNTLHYETTQTVTLPSYDRHIIDTAKLTTADGYERHIIDESNPRDDSIGCYNQGSTKLASVYYNIKSDPNSQNAMNYGLKLNQNYPYEDVLISN